MAFWAKNFVYDNVSSDSYGLRLSSPNSEEEVNIGSSVEIHNEYIYRRYKPYLYGISQNSVHEFPIFIHNDNGGFIDELMVARLSKWLFGRVDGYKKLQIQQDDVQDYYFNCIFNNPRTHKIGNRVVGFMADVICDSPFAYSFPKTISGVVAPSGGTYTTEVSLVYPSDNNDYFYPNNITLLMNPSGGNARVGNRSELNSLGTAREFLIAGVAANTTLTINMELGIIQSSNSVNYIPNFNKVFFRLIPGINRIYFQGAINTFSMSYQVLRKIGG
jgi:hypothetical protein